MTGTATLIKETAMTRFKVFAVLALAAVTLAPDFAFAGPYEGYVTAESRYGNGAVSAPVRVSQFGLQVKLPGGSWLYCESSSLLFDRSRPCSETLRRESLDFWETQSEERGGNR